MILYAQLAAALCEVPHAGAVQFSHSRRGSATPEQSMADFKAQWSVAVT
jgi:hypothetical protein